MPITASAEEKPRKRAPRKRAVATKTVRKTAAKKTVRKRTAKKRPVKRAVSAPAPSVGLREDTSSTRRAPTTIAANRAGDKARQKRVIAFFSVLAISVGLSAVVGFTDKGQIDVNRAIEERNERIRSGQSGGSGAQNVIVPVQNTEANKLPDGGLVGLTPAKPPAPKPETTTASSTASSTDETASSTDVSTEEEVGIETEGENIEDLEEITESEPTTSEEIVVEPTSGR